MPLPSVIPTLLAFGLFLSSILAPREALAKAAPKTVLLSSLSIKGLPAEELIEPIIAFGMLGVFGLALTGGDHVAGAVQWRAYVGWPGLSEATVIVGRGLIIGKPAKLSRREAILRANRRALYDVATNMTFMLNNALALKLKKKVTSGSYAAFEENTDNW